MRKTIRVLAVLLLWSLAAGAAWAQTYLEQARQHIVAKEYEQAIKVLQPNRADAQRRRELATVDNLIGWSFFCLGKMSDAEVYLTSALASAEREHNTEAKRLVTNNLGVLYFVQGDLDKSLSYFNQPLTRDTKIAQQYRSLIAKKRVEVEAERNVQQGIAFRVDQKFDQAVQSYDKALQTTPDDPRMLEYKGYSLFRLGKYDEAIAVLQAALKADIAHTRTLLPLNMIKAYCASGKDGQIAPLIRETKVSPATLKSWWETDRELQKVCAQSVALKNLLPQ